MQLPPGDHGRMIKIPIQVVDGHVETVYGAPLPAMREGAVGDLVMPADVIRNPVLAKWLGVEQQVALVPAGGRLWIAVSEHGIPKNLLDKTFRPEGLPVRDTARCVEVVLDDSLQLLLRGGKEPVLQDSRCRVAKMPCLMAESLNHVYSLVSEVFEPGRRSHSGNVFRLAFWAEGSRWWSLDDLRRHYEALLDRYLALAWLWTSMVPELEDGGRDQPALFLPLEPGDLAKVIKGYLWEHRRETYRLLDDCLKEFARRRTTGDPNMAANVDGIILARDFFAGETRIPLAEVINAVHTLLAESESYLFQPCELADGYRLAVVEFANHVLRRLVGLKKAVPAEWDRLGRS